MAGVPAFLPTAARMAGRSALWGRPALRASPAASGRRAGILPGRPRPGIARRAPPPRAAVAASKSEAVPSPAAAAAAAADTSGGTTALPGTIYLVATPIGNIADITARALSILDTVDVIAAEDTRRTGMLLSRLFPAAASGGRSRRQRLLSYHAHNTHARTPHLLALARGGQSVAVVSDAGTPGVSDPGAELVAAAVRSCVPVVPVPGACAAVAALVACGLDTSAWTFVGFLPTRRSERAKELGRLAAVSTTLVLYEAPHRVATTLAAMAEVPALRDRQLAVARELTKVHEEFRLFAGAGAAAEHYGACGKGVVKGEFVLVLGPPTGPGVGGRGPALELEERKARVMVEVLVSEGVPVSMAARAVAAAAGVSRRALYAHAVQVVKDTGGVQAAVGVSMEVEEDDRRHSLDV